MSQFPRTGVNFDPSLNGWAGVKVVAKLIRKFKEKVIHTSRNDAGHHKPGMAGREQRIRNRE